MTYSTKRSYSSYNSGSYGGSRDRGNQGNRHWGQNDSWKARKYETNFDLKDYPEDSFENSESIVKNFYVESFVTSQRPMVRIQIFIIGLLDSRYFNLLL